MLDDGPGILPFLARARFLFSHTPVLRYSS
jgi:hypothetical protein